MSVNTSFPTPTVTCLPQDLYCVRSDLGNLLKALGRLDEAKVGDRHLYTNMLHWGRPALVRGSLGGGLAVPN